jgi:hypothetical protein
MLINNSKDIERFKHLFETHIKRENADKLLRFLENGSDFFTAPASTRYHCAFEGGLCLHSLNVYDCLKDYLSRPRVKDTYGLQVSEETIAIVALLHDVCKIDMYRVEMRNRKNEFGAWEQYPYYAIEDMLPYGHGEKSVYIVGGFIKLTRQESMAIRWHMGFSGIEDKNLIGRALEQYPLAIALSTADMEASFFLEGSL